MILYNNYGNHGGVILLECNNIICQILFVIKEYLLFLSFL